MLHMAVYKQNVDIVRMLVYSGANLNAKDSKGMNPEENALLAND